MSVEDQNYEREVSCDGEGCERYFFVTYTCGLTDKQIDEIGTALGWTFRGETEAYCPHCKPPAPAKPAKKGKK
jgi:hypothetical protein